MTTLRAGRISPNIIGVPLRRILLSGTVKLGVTGVSREIKIYKNDDFDLYAETTSDVSGDWSFNVRGTVKDKFRVVCIGESGENSEIYEFIME